ncbi:hypothetical protein MTBBW1_2160008 [Desulfamplus magnetovallimortis]|uniref:Uncharacterized protein n=1 Tax=Desulfamplus magnetovallimortis TaxID=1246637 RepID=A0A1W1HCW7_9BACT|nr:hypothetical protein MTBBW1_2160008 [Desulfamplus magnetovallimortis]
MCGQNLSLKNSNVSLPDGFFWCAVFPDSILIKTIHWYLSEQCRIRPHIFI